MRQHATALLALLAALVLLTAACGSRVASPPAPLAEDEAPGSEAPSAAMGPGPQAPDGRGAEADAVDGEAEADADIQEEPGGDAAAPDDPPAGAAAAGPADPPPDTEEEVLRVTLSKDCVRRGDLLIVTLQGPPRAGVSMVIGFSDNQAHGAMMIGDSDDDGRFVWRVPIAPTVPEGTATLLASTTGADWEREGAGSTRRTFEVAGSGGCP